MKRIHLIRALLLMALPGGLSPGCHPAEGPSEFQLVHRVPVEEKEVVITRKPSYIQVLDKTTVAIVINNRHFQLHDLSTGKVTHRLNLSTAFEDSLYQVLSRKLVERKNNNGGDYTLFPDLDSVRTFLQQYKPGTPYFQLGAFFHYEEEDSLFYLFYEMETPLRGSTVNGIASFRSRAMLTVDRELNIKEAYTFTPLPEDRPELNQKADWWPYFGYLVRGDFLVTYLNTPNASSPIREGRFLARAHIDRNSHTISYAAPVDIRFPETVLSSMKNRFFMFHASQFHEEQGAGYFSNGEGIHEVQGGKELYPGLNRDFPVDRLYNFGWSPEHPNTFYYTLLTHDTTRQRGMRFHFRITDIQDQKILDTLSHEPYHTKPTYANDHLYLLTREGEHYYFETYACE